VDHWTSLLRQVSNQVIRYATLYNREEFSMKRLVWGIVLVVLVIMSISGTKGDMANDQVVMNALILIGGGTLIFYGSQYLKQLKSVTAHALQMNREDGKIDAGLLAQRMGMSEVDVRGYIAVSQRKGVIPFKSEII
jgi:arginine exporter protein ArgO